MCGIVGAYGKIDTHIIENMILRIAHRGPDHIHSVQLGNVHLAHARLSIIDISESSHQPLFSQDKQYCIIFNGEIYNYKTLRQELIDLGYKFSSQGDAEVILNLYRHFGQDCLSKLSGIFAFAIWDECAKELFIARDPFGVKPLYYSENAEGFYFASELKALLLVPSIAKTLNYDAIFRTIVLLWSPGPDTVLKQILKLKPGHYLIIKDGKTVKYNKYYNWPLFQPKKITVNAACKKIDRAVQGSVQEQLVSDVPLGAFLSGGLDSSVIVAMAKKAGASVLKCFTIDTMDLKQQEGFIDDLPYAKKAAQFLDVDLSIVKANPDLIKLLPKIVYHLDEPQADLAPLNVYLICEYARQMGIKVMLSGVGGDDLFTGYRRHRAIKIDKYFSYMPMFMRVLFKRLLVFCSSIHPHIRRFKKLFAYVAEGNDERLLAYFYWIDPTVVHQLFADELKSQLNENPMSSLLAELKTLTEKSRLEKMLYLERQYFLVDHNLNYTDKMAMAHGVEVRVPFLDYNVVDIASVLKERFKQRHYEGKWILKKMAERYLPKSIIYRSKTGFGGPLRTWLNHDLKAVVDNILSKESLLHRGIFNPDSVRYIIEQDRAGKEDYSYSIFALLNMELWFRIFIDDKPYHSDAIWKNKEVV